MSPEGNVVAVGPPTNIHTESTHSGSGSVGLYKFKQKRSRWKGTATIYGPMAFDDATGSTVEYRADRFGQSVALVDTAKSKRKKILVGSQQSGDPDLTDHVPGYTQVFKFFV